MSQARPREAKRNTTQAHCNGCGRSTNHDVIAADREEYEEAIGERDIVCFDNFEMLKCRGCDSISMRVTSRHIEDNEPRITYYPPAIARRAPAWLAFPDILMLPMNLFPLINEVYTAVQNGLLQLGAMGIRATLELVMKNKIGDNVREKASFQELVDEFQKAGYLSTRQAGSLATILQAGHEAVHRGWEPTEADVATLLDITEAVVATAYLHEARAQALEARLPKRPRHT